MFNHQCCAPVRDTATGVGTRENLTWLLPACPKPAPCPRSTSPSQTIPAAEPSGCYQEEAELQLLSPSSHHLGCQEDPCLESRCSQAGTRVSPAHAEAAQARAEHEGSPWRRCVSVCTHKHGAGREHSYPQEQHEGRDGPVFAMSGPSSALGRENLI